MSSHKALLADMRARADMTGRVALVIGSLLFSLFVLELGCRLGRGPSSLVHWPNLVLEYRINTRANGVGRLMPDPQLGFVATPGFVVKDLTYDAHGWRVAPRSEERRVGKECRYRLATV